MDWHTLSVKEVFDKLHSSEKGLDKKEVEDRLNKFGKNELKKTRQFNALKIFFEQFKSYLILILLFAAIISFFMESKVDAFVIVAIILLNSGLGFFQEYKAEKAIQSLKKMLVPQSTVIRNYRIMKIKSQDLVPGDILVFEEGDKITADARLISSNGIKVNESALTGESVPVEKIAAKLSNVLLVERINMIYQGTEIVSGNGKAIVVATGMNTEIGKISVLVQQVHPEKNPFKDKLDRFAQKIGILVLVLSILIVVLLTAAGFDIFNSFIVAVSLAVSAIPEGLPAVISFGLAFATRRMLNNHVLIRKLQASETLGRVTVICTDKTGTLTEGKMSVADIYTNGKINPAKNKELLLKIGALCNKSRVEENEEGEYFVGDPTEIALLISAKNNFLDKIDLTRKEKKIKEFSFNSEKKMMSVIRKGEGKIISYVKGAPEKIIEKSSYELINGEKIKIDEHDKVRLMKHYESMAKKGLRVLAFAFKEFPVYTKTEHITEKMAEDNLVFVGLQGMIDPPRSEVKESIQLCKDAGIKIIMMTGDSRLTAEAVAAQINLTGKSVDSSELGKMSDRELLTTIDSIGVFSRVSPEDKLRVINILKQRKEVVAMTGDGVNDSLALKRADVGIAMGIRGTEVTKDASDIVILDDNFASIVKGVREGRAIYENIKKFIKYLLTANFSEVALVLIVILVWRNPELLPLLPLQILWINLVTDSLPALALSSEQPEKDIMKRKPSQQNLLNGIKTFIFVGGLIATLIGLYFFITYLDNIDKARTMVVTASIVFQMFLVFNSKSDKSIFSSPFNKYLFYAVFISLFLHIIAMYTSLNSLFYFVPLGFYDWSLILLAGLIGFVCMEILKKTSFLYSLNLDKKRK
ncbi:cation-translocating P-type ATPase [Candidatus Pacearchaeota archaeon]|nr:cation-translocating P-type ATPase [Candidatus Pacearchaeota archaeon]